MYQPDADAPPILYPKRKKKFMKDLPNYYANVSNVTNEYMLVQLTLEVNLKSNNTVLKEN